MQSASNFGTSTSRGQPDVPPKVFEKQRVKRHCARSVRDKNRQQAARGGPGRPHNFWHRARRIAVVISLDYARRGAGLRWDDLASFLSRLCAKAD